MPTSQLYVDHRMAFDVRGSGQGASSNQLRGGVLLNRLGNSLANGSKVSAEDMPIITFFPNSSGLGTQAYSALVLSTASGSVGAVINGVTITATAAGGDIATAGLIAAAITASVDSLVQHLVSASTQRASFTVNVGSMVVGDFVVILGQKLTAYSGSVANLPGFFDISSASSNAVATNIVVAINTHPVLSQFLKAHTNGSNAVQIWLIKGASIFPFGVTNVMGTNNTGGIQSLLQFASVAGVCIFALAPGILGNQITLAASGTGVTVDAQTTASGRMIGGVGGSVNPITLAASDL